MRHTTPQNLCDSYKLGHAPMYPPGMTKLQSNWTARSSRIDGVNKTLWYGFQAYAQKILIDFWNEQFFHAKDPSAVLKRHKRRAEGLLAMSYDDSRWQALHRLGYLPLEFRAFPEGTQVPIRIPSMLVDNTVDGYGWLVNYLESVQSAEIWLPITSATIALRFRQLFDVYAQLTSDIPELVDWQGHDFSYRGMGGTEAASMSGAGHLLSFAGTDSLVAMDWAEYFYDAPGWIGGSVPASEHSVTCAGGELSERETFEHVMRVFPTGIVSMVSDTWDLWHVLTVIVPSLKAQIMAREGKLVIRPDSGDPVLILCGDPNAPEGTAARNGVIETLFKSFGGTINSKGYKQLDPHIGAIYGDAITYDRAVEICKRLEAKRFASTNVVLGIGSFTYQYVTRDTFGMAMKATWCEVDGIGRAMFKDPITDNSGKRSARGRLAVVEKDGEMVLIENATPADEARSLLQPVWRDGKFVRRHTFREIAQRVGVRKLLPE